MELAAELAVRLFAAWNAKDADALSGLVTEDAQWTTPFGMTMSGRDEIVDGHRYAFSALFGDADLDLEDTRTRELSPGLVLVTASWSMAGHVLPDGSRGEARRGAIHLVARGDPARAVVVLNQDYVGQYRPSADDPPPDA